MSSTRKRVISSCIPCYTRKQKCNREYPCNHCTRRQRIDGCIYNPIVSSNSTTSSPPPLHIVETRRDRDGVEKAHLPHPLPPPPPAAAVTHPLRDEWCESFGYFHDSNSNTLAIIQKLGVACYDDSHASSSPALGPEAASELLGVIERMPDRQVMDFLVYFFATEICWIDQLVHGPWFLEKYQRWNAAEWAKSAPDVEFAVLVLRICSYALQFLPSPAYPLDRIRGELLSDLRKACNDAADKTEAISAAADSRGSPVRAQHLAFLGLKYQAEGNMRAYAEALGRAIRVAQNVGMHCDTSAVAAADEVDREMARRVFCNLYIADSLLSRQLDRAPFLPGRLAHGSQPQLQQVVDPFAERLLQARLADFWRDVSPPSGAEYDAMAAGERYDRFCREFLPQLPPSFTLARPDESRDKQFPRLPLQRQLLHTAVYDSLCWNFRPLLLRRPAPLPAYKAVLLGFQKKSLAVAALRALDSVGLLHTLLGGRHTRLASIVISTFEATVLLLSLLADPSFPGERQRQDTSYSPPTPPPPHEEAADPLQEGILGLSRSECLQAVQGGLDRLKMLAEVSSMAARGASTLGQLLSRLSESEGLSAAASTGAVTTPGAREEEDVDGEFGKETGESTVVGSLPAAWLNGGPDLPGHHRLAVEFAAGGGTGTPPASVDVSQWLSFDAANIASYTQSGDFWGDHSF